MIANVVVLVKISMSVMSLNLPAFPGTSRPAVRVRKLVPVDPDPVQRGCPVHDHMFADAPGLVNHCDPVNTNHWLSGEPGSLDRTAKEK